MIAIQKLRLDGLLSFAPDSETFELRDLNVLIGPNGSGKSNLIEALELLAATPHDFAATVRDGGARPSGCGRASMRSGRQRSRLYSRMVRRPAGLCGTGWDSRRSGDV